MQTQRTVIWILITLVFTVLMCTFQGIGVAWAGAERTVAIAAGLLVGGYVLRSTAVGTTMQAAGLWSCFILVFVYALRAVATTARPYGDPWLATLDMGLALDVYAWSKQFPRVDAFLSAIYNSTHAQTLIAILFLTVTNQRARISTLLVRFILAGLLTLIGFYWLPAQGTVAWGLPVPEGYGDILVELDRLRAGVTSIGGPETTALITFPSFHVVSAVLLVSVYHGSWLFRPVLVLNGLMVLSTMTVGMHYAVDVVAGLAICAAVISCTRLPVLAAPEHSSPAATEADDSPAPDSLGFPSAEVAEPAAIHDDFVTV